MKRLLSGILAFILIITSSMATYQTVYASTVIPTVYIDSYTSGANEGDDATITIKLDNPATEQTTVWYRTQFGSAHNLSTVVSLGKFIDFVDNSVVFNAGEVTKQVVIPHHELDSYEESSRFYAVVLYKASGNVLIDKERDFLEIAHKEDTSSISTGNYTLKHETSEQFADDDDTYYYPNTTGLTWNNVNYTGRYWSRIGANSYNVWLDSKIYAKDSTLNLYFHVNGSSQGSYGKDSDMFKENGYATKILGPASIGADDTVRVKFVVDNAMGEDHGKVIYYHFYGQPVDSTAPTVQKLIFYPGDTTNQVKTNYSEGQEFFIGVQFNEIVRVTSGQEAAVQLPIKTDDGSLVYAKYYKGSGTDVLVFKYSVEAGKTANPIKLDYSDVFYGEAYVKDIAGNGFNDGSMKQRLAADGSFLLDNGTSATMFTFDGTKPAITGITSDKKNVALRSSAYVDITLKFDRKVKLLGDAKLTLNNGAVATKTKSSAFSTSHKFRYNVGSSITEDTLALKVTGLTGATVISENEASGFVFPSGDNIASENIIIDNTKPDIKINYITTPGVYSQSHTINVTATDAGSGVNMDKVYQYGFTEDSYGYTGLLGENLDLSQASSTKVYIRVSDIAGNVQSIVTNELKFDKAPPTVNFSYPDAGNPKSKANVGIVIADSLSGLANIAEYTWYDENNLALGDSNGTITGLSGTGANNRTVSYAPQADGKYKLKLTVKDMAGNTTQATSNLIYVDKTAPDVSITPEITDANKSSYNIVITGADPNGSNVDGSIKYIKYRWESEGTVGEWVQVNDNVAEFSHNNYKASGESFLEVVVADNAGSTEGELNKAQRFYRFTFDNDPPVIDTSSEVFNTTSSAISINISTTDDFNPVSEVYYAFRRDSDTNYGGSDWSSLGKASGDVTKNDDNGTFYLHVKAADTQGNEAYHVSEPFIMDNEPAIGTIKIAKNFTNSDTVQIELTHNDYGVVQYKLSEDGETYDMDYQDFVPSLSYTFSDNSEGVKKIYLMLRDAYENESVPIYETVTLDKTPPSAKVVYSTTAPTKDEVVASITDLSDNFSSAVKISANTMNYTFVDNGIYNFTIRDEAGNQSYVKAEVTWIDKASPVIQFLPESDTLYTKEKDVQLRALKQGREVTAQYRVIDGNDVELKSFASFEDGDIIVLNYDNPVYIEVYATDDLGNGITKRSGIYNVDNLPPIPKVSYSITTRTANDVTATVTFNEPTVITNNSGKNNYTFTENGEFTFEFTDIAGNTAEVLVAVENIDRSIPSARITLSETEYTAGPIYVTASVEALPKAEIGTAMLDGNEITPFSTKTRQINGNETVYEAVYEIDSNGSFGVDIIDAETLISEVTSMLISNIDKEPPIFSYTLNNYGKTNKNIDVTISYSDAKSEPVTIVSAPVEAVDGVYTLTENGEYIFALSDAVGNQKEYTVVIENIDRELNPEIIYSTQDFTNEDVTATVFCNDEEIFVRNNYENPVYTFTENGEFTFEVYDVAGNVVEVTAVVDWINKVGFDFAVVPSTKEKTNKPVVLAIEPASMVAYAESKEGLPQVEGTNNQFSTTEVGTYRFIVTDIYNNVKEISYYVGNVDCIPPQLNYTLGLNTAEGRITLNEGQEITNVSNSIRITFSSEEMYDFIEYDRALEYDKGAYAFTAYKNGTYTFKARDIAGNESSKTITLTKIDNEAPNVTITYTTKALTNQNVIASVSSDEEIFIVNNYRSPHRLFTENGTFTFQVSDVAGNRTEVTAVVNNIDKTPPVINISYSTSERTNKNVIVSLSSDETFFVKREATTKVETGQSFNYTFEDNHTAFFVVKDEAGNTSTIFTKAENIDKEAPNILFLTDKPVLVNVGDSGYDFTRDAYSNSTDVARVLVDTSGVNFSKGGLYEVIYKMYDDVGNMGTRSRLVDIVDPNEPLLVRINGMNPAYNNYFKSNSIEIELMNAHDTASIYYMFKRCSITEVKQSGTLLAGRVINVEKSGWYSILIFDKDSNRKFYQIFVAK